MASSVVLKVIAPPPASGQPASNGSQLPCTSLSSNGPSVSTLDCPLPLEATPLPPSVLSPKLAIALENGVAVSVEKQQEQPPKPVLEEPVLKPAGSPLPTLNVLRTPYEVVSARELLDVNQLLQGPLQGVLAEKPAADATRVSPPSLHANEEMLDDDSDQEDEMETNPGPQQPDPAPQQPAAVSGAATTSVSDTLPASCPSLPPSTRSDSASPYADDDSFAMFVAQEANETASAIDPDNSSLSPSPAPLSTDPLASSCSSFEGFLNSSGSGSAMVQQFGVTAACPSTPLQLDERAASAPLDMTAHNFPKRSKYAHRAAISAMHPYNRTRGGGGASVAKTLDLLKTVLQPSFNMEVKRLCDDYKYIYAMAATNIRENTGDTVPQSTLKLLIMKMMEEAHQGYVNGKWEFPMGKLPTNEKVTETKGSPMATKKLNRTEKDARCGPSKRLRKPPLDRQTDRSSGLKGGMDRRRLDPVKWDPSKLSLETEFVLGVGVNKALGHAANRGKVYYLHPELFKYACDGDDKTWLYENKHLPVHGGKAFLMIYSEVLALVQTEECYKDNEDISSDVLKLDQFPVPQFMVDKMKRFMKSVQGYFTQESSQATSEASASSSSPST